MLSSYDSCTTCDDTLPTHSWLPLSLHCTFVTIPELVQMYYHNFTSAILMHFCDSPCVLLYKLDNFTCIPPCHEAEGLCNVRLSNGEAEVGVTIPNRDASLATVPELLVVLKVAFPAPTGTGSVFPSTVRAVGSISCQNTNEIEP